VVLLLFGIGALALGLGGLLAGVGICQAGLSISRSADSVAVTVGAIPAQINDLIEVARDLPAAILPPVLKTVDDARRDVTARAGTQITALRLELLPRVDALTAQIAGVRTDLQPTFQNLAAITATANKDLADARPAVEQAFNPAEVAGVVRDTRFAMARAARTFGNVEAATDDFRGALPKILVTFQGIGDNAQATTAASILASNNTAKLMFNLAEETKPWPRPIRYILQGAGYLAPIGSGIIGSAAAMGAFAK
jgi:hypothetical protein